MTLAHWGWDEEWVEKAAPLNADRCRLARITGQDKGSWFLQTDHGPRPARVPSSQGPKPFPVVGDWVVADPGPHRTDPWSIAVTWDSGASPEIVLTKTDLTPDLEAEISRIQRVAVGVPVRSVSSSGPDSVQRLRDSLEPGLTVCLLGPSGVGTSTLVNLLSGTVVARTGGKFRRLLPGSHRRDKWK